MTVVGLHPEDLLDKDARGALTASERARLDAHMDGCTACRLARQMRADFAGELEGEDPRISVSGLLALAGVSTNAPGDATRTGGDEERAAASARRGLGARRRVHRATWLLAAAALFAAGAASATGIGQRAWSRLVGEVAPAATLASAPKPLAQKHVARHAAAAPPATPGAPALAPAETNDVLATPQPAPALARAPAAAPAHSHAGASAASLFESANEARRHGEYSRALALHRELESHFPSSPEARVSRATTGQLLLDLGDPSGALASFEAYLASGSGELGEEAMVGRATALERLGRADDARQAWQSLLAAFPSSPYAAHAKRRLAPR